MRRFSVVSFDNASRRVLTTSTGIESSTSDSRHHTRCNYSTRSFQGYEFSPGRIFRSSDTLQWIMASVVFSYSHHDEALRGELEAHLAGLRREGLITTWHDRRIVAGQPL